MMKYKLNIWASIYSLGGSIEESLNRIDSGGVGGLHFDAFEDDVVLGDATSIRNQTSLPFEMHAVGKRSSISLEKIRDSGFQRLMIQAESLVEGFNLPTKIWGLEVGVAVLPGNIGRFSNLIDWADYLCVMATTPGLSGLAFPTAALESVRMAKESFPAKRLVVDGGVTEKIVEELISLGVEEIVVGSRLAGLGEDSSLLAQLALGPKVWDYRASDLMRPIWETPTLRIGVEQDSILEALEVKKAGFVALLDSAGKPAGIVTDGDVRRAFIAAVSGSSGWLEHELINRDPVAIHAETPASKIIEATCGKARRIPVVFVVDSEGILQGHLRSEILALL